MSLTSATLMAQETSAETVLGWRYEPIVARTAVIHLEPRHKRPVHQLVQPAKHKRPMVPFSRFADDGTTEPARCSTVRFQASFLDQVGHLKEPHTTPHRSCECGYRVVPSLTSLTRYMKHQQRQMQQMQDLHINRLPPGAIYQVSSVGPVLRSGVGYDDPPGSFRAAGMAMTGVVFLPDSGVGRAARRALTRLRLPLDLRMVDSVLGLRDSDAPVVEH